MPHRGRATRSSVKPLRDPTVVRARPLVMLREAVSAVATSRRCAMRCAVANGSCRDGQTGHEAKERQKPAHVLIFPVIPDEGNTKSDLTGGER